MRPVETVLLRALNDIRREHEQVSASVGAGGGVSRVEGALPMNWESLESEAVIDPTVPDALAPIAWIDRGLIAIAVALTAFFGLSGLFSIWFLGRDPSFAIRDSAFLLIVFYFGILAVWFIVRFDRPTERVRKHIREFHVSMWERFLFRR